MVVDVTIMADSLERFEAELDLDVTFNEFDEELSNVKENGCEQNTEKVILVEKREENVKQNSCTRGDENGLSQSFDNEIIDSARTLVDNEEGEVLSSSDGEGEEKMDLDEKADKDQNSLTGSEMTTTLSEHKGLAKTDDCTFLSPNSVFRNFGKKENLVKDSVDETLKRDYEADSAVLSMESDSSMDDQSWKRKKRARLEEQSHPGTGEGDNIKTSDKEVVKKTRAGRRKRKREIRRHHKDGQQPKNSRSNHQDVESGNQKVLQTLRVTSDDAEEVVAREIAYKLNESKVILIQRVVTCIGCEKAIKLFRDTQEVERHGGIWTKDGDRRRTSGGVFLSLLKHRYVTKEQSKWIFAIENEISKKKAKEEQQRMTEFKKKTVSDLRLKLKERERDKESKN